jgi:hypothetical protein
MLEVLVNGEVIFHVVEIPLCRQCVMEHSETLMTDMHTVIFAAPLCMLGLSTCMTPPRGLDYLTQGLNTHQTKV